MDDRPKRIRINAVSQMRGYLWAWPHSDRAKINLWPFHLFNVLLQLNHFPGTFQIGRKDRLWRNLSKMQLRFGKQEFSFFPRTFILPQDIKLLRKAWEDGSSRQKWIIKPVRSASTSSLNIFNHAEKKISFSVISFNGCLTSLHSVTYSLLQPEE